MTEINRSNLFGKLNAQLFRAAEAATVFCKLRGNPYVELVHWLHQIAQDQDSDFRRIARHYGLDAARLEADLMAELDRLPRGATAISDFSEHIEHAIERAWIYATLLYGDSVVRSGYVVVGILKTTNLRGVLNRMSAEFAKLQPDMVADALPGLIKDSVEASMPANDGISFSDAGAPGEASQALGGGKSGKGDALKKYAVDLTAKAREGSLDPVSGRDDEIRQVIDILMRRRQNNPLLAGEAGVGKTAVVEGFATRVAKGDVPPALRGVSVLTLDIGLLQAGASMKGEFEQRLRSVIDEVQASAKPIVLFIDEIHTLIGAGGAAGTGDAANLLKPALARGTLRTIGATTWGEYKKYIEKDPALTRRFQVIQIDEPSEEKAVVMLRGIASYMEEHHRVLVLDQAVEAAVRLSHRYIPARQLPDKAVSLLDTACARVSLSQHATPPHVESIERRIEALELEASILKREASIGMDSSERAQEIDQQLGVCRTDLEAAKQRWETERCLVDRLFALRAELSPETVAKPREAAALMASASGADSSPPPGAEAVPNPAETGAPAAGAPPSAVAATPVALTEEQRAAKLADLTQVQKELQQVQGEEPLVMPSVDDQAVATVVSDWTGIPVGRMVKDEISSVLALADALEKRVVGQRHSLDMIARRVQISRARLDDPVKPVGVFMLVGPSGVGKTETALALAETLYGGEQNLISINMSEFQEAHTVSTLKGAPPGYVGYGEGGVLTEAVRRKPYSVVLLDEVEKAHSDVHEIFFQVFDKGYMEDGEGRHIDFKNTVIILTSNVGSDLLTSMCADPDLMPEPDALARAMREPLLKVFPAAFLGRLVQVPYYPLASAMLSQIVQLKLGHIQKRMAANHRAAFTWDQKAIDVIMSRATEIASGARMVDAILANNVLPRISREFLERALAGTALVAVQMTAEDNDLRLAFTPEAPLAA